jgi:hypothetical protein
VHAKHDGEKPVCQRHLCPADAILRHEQPAGEALFQLAAAIGNRRLRSLNQEGWAQRSSERCRRAL